MTPSWTEDQPLPEHKNDSGTPPTYIHACIHRHTCTCKHPCMHTHTPLHPLSVQSIRGLHPQTPAPSPSPLDDPSWIVSACISNQAHHIRQQPWAGSYYFEMPLFPVVTLSSASDTATGAICRPSADMKDQARGQGFYGSRTDPSVLGPGAWVALRPLWGALKGSKV